MVTSTAKSVDRVVLLFVVDFVVDAWFTLEDGAGDGERTILFFARVLFFVWTRARPLNFYFIYRSVDQLYVYSLAIRMIHCGTVTYKYTYDW